MSLPKFSKCLELVSTTKTRLDLTSILKSYKKELDDIANLEINDSVLKITFTDKSTVDTAMNQLFDFSVPANRSESVFVFGTTDNIRCTKNETWDNVKTIDTELSREAAKHDPFHAERFYRDYDETDCSWLIDDLRYDEYLYFDIDTRHLSLCSDHAFNDELHVTKTPIYAYIHSGITVSTTPFSCTWDSGVIGYVYHDFDQSTTIESIISRLDDYLTGNVWRDRYDDDALISDTDKQKIESELNAMKEGAK